ncbi:hypothetical protein BJQ97_03511 [Geobacillus sp. TFV-3]|nr:DUF554 family protein [Geobacillus sp. TFV-3]KAF0996821.1 hypothetical protein BJQ97_03511 [Geobacillus sp. TFV-3]
MVLLGTIINGVSIIAGALIGKWLHRIPERVKETVMGGFIGLNMLGLTNIRVANLLPSILITATAVFILSLV